MIRIKVSFPITRERYLVLPIGQSLCDELVYKKIILFMSKTPDTLA